MGRYVFEPEVLGDSLSETVGYKSGLALSIQEMCGHLVDTGYDEILSGSESYVVTLRSEEYDDLFYKLLHKIGYTEEEFDGDLVGVGLFHKYKDTKLYTVYMGVLQLYADLVPKMIESAVKNKEQSLDPTLFIDTAYNKFGKAGADIAIEQIKVISRGLLLYPSSGLRYTEWKDTESLDSLFKGSSKEPEYGKYIDQRFVNYLSTNQDKLENIHWRKFEELTAEYFFSSGYEVELGPGSNDDGVDVRVWEKYQNPDEDTPHIIIQCKRQKKKIEKVVVKGLYSDIQFFGAKYGLIVTTSELSVGARKTIMTRGYSIQEINKYGVQNWLKELRKPGTGIVRST